MKSERKKEKGLTHPLQHALDLVQLCFNIGAYRLDLFVDL